MSKTTTAIFICIGQIDNYYAFNPENQGTSANNSTLFAKKASINQTPWEGEKYRLTYCLLPNLDNRAMEIEKIEQVN